MNTASFDYAVLNDSVAAELETLRAEKQLLTENIRTTEQRLSEITLREEKLARLSESLTDLLTTYPSNTKHQPDLSLASGNDKPVIEETSPVTDSNESNKNASPAQSSALDLDSESESETVNAKERLIENLIRQHFSSFTAISKEQNSRFIFWLENYWNTLEDRQGSGI